MDIFYCIWLTYVVVGCVNVRCRGLSSEGTPYNYTVCAGTTFQASCVNDEVIAVRSIQHGGKLTGSCSSSDCCVYDKADCLLPYSDNNLQAHCSGRVLCESILPSSADATGCGSSYPILSQYLTMEYYCLPETRIASMCGSSSLTTIGHPVYIKNFYYPSTTILSADTSCSCSVEANSCSSRLNVSFVHFQLSDDGSCTGAQRIQINDDGTVHDYTCSDNTGYEITYIRTSESNYLTVTLDNPNGVNGGVFWIAFEATASSVELTVTCPAASKTMCIDCSAVTVDNSTRSPSTSTSTYSTGTTVTYTCNIGFERTTGDEQIVCGTGGSWIGTAPTCTVKKCAAPTAVDHSSISSEKSSYAYGESVTYTCEAGYQNTGGPLSRQCTDTNAWSGTAPVCTMKKCAAPTTVDHSSISPEKSSYAYGEYVAYTCEVGYQNTGGPLSRQCTDTDAWSGTAPVCTNQEPNQQFSETTTTATGTTGNNGQLSSMSITMLSFIMSLYIM